MIEFTLNRNRNGKKSRWAKRYPRKRILKRGSEKGGSEFTFAAFIIYYAIHAGWNPNECKDYTHVFSLRGDNIVTRGLLKVKNLLCKRV